MAVRATPTLTECSACGVRMAAVRGPFSLVIGRAKPPQGFRLGWIAETDTREVPLCAECVKLALRHAAA